MGKHQSPDYNHYGYVTAMVHHGDCSLMRLTSRFYFGDEEKYYSFIKFPRYDDFKEADDFKALIKGEKLPSNRLLRISGPSGTGKSFYLQYILRHIRSQYNLRALYLANPEIYLEPEINYLALFLELVYSLAEDLVKDRSWRDYFISQAAALLAPHCPSQLKVFKSTLKDALNRLKKAGKHLVIVMDQEDWLESANEVICPKKARLMDYLRGGRHGAYVLSSQSYSCIASKSETPSRSIVRLLSDDAIMTILKSRCSISDTVLESTDARFRSTVEIIVNTIGRCPADIHRMLNARRRGLPCLAGISSLLEKFRLDTEAVIKRHEVFYNGLDSLQQQAFLMMLFMVGKCPPIGSAGYYSSKSDPFQVSRNSQYSDEDWDDGLDEYVRVGLMLLSEDSDDISEIDNGSSVVHEDCDPIIDSRENGGSPYAEDNFRETGKPDGYSSGLVVPHDRHTYNEEYYTIDIFSSIPGLAHFANAEDAECALDRRYFFIDELGYVRPISDPAFCIIKAFHQRNHSTELLNSQEFIRQATRAQSIFSPVS